MFNNFFTTYQAVESPPIVDPDTKLVEENYNEFMRFDYPTKNSTEIAPMIFPSDPFEVQTDTPVVFDTYKTPDQLIETSVKTDDSEQILQLPIKNTTITQFDGKNGYVKNMYQYLYQALENNGIDGKTWAPILVAHTSIESGWGNKFSRENNNFGGIKGKGSKVVSTKEWSPSKGYYTIKDSFKSYPSIQAFADDYVKKLKNKFKAFNGTPADYLRNIRKHGYFTASLSDYQRIFNGRLKEVNKLLGS